MEGLFSPSICFSRKENGALTSMRLLTGDSMAFGYDTLSRLKTRKIAGQVLETYSYTPGSGSSTTTTLVAEKKNQVNGSTVQNLQYQYDARGNITKVADTTANTSVFYTYDCQGQLLKAIHKKGTATQRTETYSYDTYGNIRSYSNGTNSHSYTYADPNGWKDLLTKVDGHSLSYDGSGNPLSYYNGKSYAMTWNEGRQLASLTTSGKTTTYTYDLNGLRTKKVNPDGTWVKYFVGDGKILGETLHAADNHEVYDMRYTFDENGEVCGISLWNQGDTSWTKYYFVKNLQGDVLAVYQYGSSFTKVAEYTYDSWGNVLTATGTLANINPFRYRSYYRDAETGFYYLQSRYYDPAIGRFINADSLASTGQDFVGYNMFAYCRNNPSSRKDVHGRADENAAEEARQGLSTLLDTYATISEFGFSIDIESETASWDASIKKLGIHEAYDYMSDYLCQKYNDTYGEEFLFSNKCVSYEIEYHVDAYMCVNGYKGYKRNITTFLFSNDKLIAHCKSVDISTNDIGNKLQETIFNYKGGIRDCYKYTDRDPYVKKKKFICWEFYVR